MHPSPVSPGHDGRVGVVLRGRGDRVMRKRRFLPMTLIAAAGLFSLTFMAGGSAVAQQSSGTPGAGMETAHPAHIHSGSCSALGDVVYPLTDVTEAGMMSTPMADIASPVPTMASGAGVSASPSAEASSSGDEDIVAESTTTVQVALADISAGGFAINVHESMKQIQNYIACGDITGTPANNMLQIPLNELNDSGYYGTATLTDNGDGTTTVVVKLAKTGGMATPTS